MEPLIFSDVNGVVAVAARPSSSNNFKKASGDFGYIVYSPEVVAFFNQHPHNIKWLTTWGTHAQTELAPALGISTDIEAQLNSTGLGTIGNFVAPHIDAGNWWKINEVIKALDEAPSRKVAWVDDNIPYSAPKALKAKYGDRLLLLETRPTQGITTEDIQLLEKFLQG
ncbi:MAG: hypothetical protein QM632_04565 [Micrococcaceae bacterium]